jgi:single-strand DNA-binding protein
MQRNRIEVSGFLAAKPTARQLPSGTSVANARIGQTLVFPTKDGVKKHTNWFNLSFYGAICAIATTYEKGDNIYVVGTVQQRQFTPKDGSTRTVYEIVVHECHRLAKPTTAEQPATSMDTIVQEDTADPEGEVDAWAAI